MLLLVIAAPTFFLGGLLVKQKIIQVQMEERLEQLPVQTISLPLEGVSWIRGGKEVVVEGKLFDIQSYTVSGNKIILRGLFDNDEDHVVAKMNDAIHKNKDGNSTPLHALALKFFSQQVYNDLVLFSINNSWKIVYTQQPFFTTSLTEEHCFLAVPPPKTA